MGLIFPPRDLKFALIEASQGSVGRLVDQALLYCFKFDPKQGRYTWAVFALLKLVGAFTLLALATTLFFLMRRPRLSADTQSEGSAE